MDSVLDFEAAVAEAQVELGEASSVDELVSDQAVSVAGEQPQAPTVDDSEAEVTSAEDEGDVFSELEIQLPQPTPAPEGTYQLPGIEQPVSLQELKDGYLRNADYTRKTQALSGQKKQLEQADRFWKALEADPLGVARTLAVKAGLIAEDAQPLVNVDIAPLRTEAEIEAEVERRVAMKVGNHPTVLAAAHANSQAWLKNELARVDQLAGRPLPKESQAKLLKAANALGVTDLVVVYNHLMAEQMRRQQAAAAIREAAPERASVRSTGVKPVEEAIDSFDDAVEAALIQVGSKR